MSGKIQYKDVCTDAIHQIDRNEWLLLTTFQQGLRQNLSLLFVLTQKNAFS